MRTKTLSILLSLTVVFTAFIVACGSGSGSTNSNGSSSDFIKAYFKNLKDGNYKEVILMIEGNDKLSENQLNKQIDFLKQATEMVNAHLDGLKSIEIVEERQGSDGNSLDVKCKTRFGNGQEKEEVFKLIKINGNWKFKELN